MIEVGDTIGDYRVVGVLGRGGMGKVFRVRSLITDREEAMKVVLPDAGESSDLAERFLREVKVHAKLEHPNIAALRTAMKVGDRVVMILELVVGVSLEEIVRQGPMAPGRAVAIVNQVLSALDFAHAQGVIHRDIKPANILVTAAGQVKLTDFGIARIAASERFTLTGLAVGSLPYMAPEQIGRGDVDARSDIYSLGVTLYQMVTGRRPIEGASEYALMHAQLAQMPPAPSDLVPGIPAALSAAIMKALAKDRRDRFQSAAEFRSGLQGLEAAAAMPTMTLPTPIAIPPEELARIESKLSRVLGPIAPRLTATAARKASSVEDLCHRLAEQISDASEREAFLKSVLGGTSGSRSRTAAPSSASQPGTQREWDPALLDRIAKALTIHIGPIAKVIVNRAAKKAHSEDELIAAAAAEIESEAARKRFVTDLQAS
jgi:serine/threonine-protein kinase